MAIAPLSIDVFPPYCFSSTNRICGWIAAVNHQRIESRLQATAEIPDAIPTRPTIRAFEENVTAVLILAFGEIQRSRIARVYRQVSAASVVL
jgi:hypothetical protein